MKSARGRFPCPPIPSQPSSGIIGLLLLRQSKTLSARKEIEDEYAGLRSAYCLIRKDAFGDSGFMKLPATIQTKNFERSE